MENKNTFKNIIEQLIIVIYIYIIIIILHHFFTDNSLEQILITTGTSFLMVAAAIIIKNLVKKPNLPGFAWGTLVSFALTLPISPVQQLILDNMAGHSFSLVGLPLLAFAGISVGNQLDVLKKSSWKLVLIALVVMASTYFGSAIVSGIVLKRSGLI